jgi:hypothetical protein
VQGDLKNNTLFLFVQKPPWIYEQTLNMLYMVLNPFVVVGGWGFFWGGVVFGFFFVITY